MQLVLRSVSAEVQKVLPLFPCARPPDAGDYRWGRGPLQLWHGCLQSSAVAIWPRHSRSRSQHRGRQRWLLTVSRWHNSVSKQTAESAVGEHSRPRTITQQLCVPRCCYCQPHALSCSLPPSLPLTPPPWLCLSLLAYLPLLESLHVCQYLSTSHPLPVCSSLHIFLSLTGLDTWGGTIRLANNICSKLLTCHCRKSSGQTFDWIWWSFMVLIQILTKANFKVHTNIKSKNKH